MTRELVTARLVLRRPKPGDVDDLHQVFSSPEAMRWWSTTPHETVEKTAEWLDGMIAADPELSDDFVIEALLDAKRDHRSHMKICLRHKWTFQGVCSGSTGRIVAVHKGVGGVQQGNLTVA